MRVSRTLAPRALGWRVVGLLMAPLLGCEALVKLDYRFQDSALEPDASASGGAASGGSSGGLANGGKGGGGASTSTEQTAGAAGDSSGSGSAGAGCDAGGSQTGCTEATVTLQGSVQQYDTRQPLAGVGVGSVGGPTVMTDANGGFSYPVPPGSTSLALILTQPGQGVPAFLRTVLQIDDPLSASRSAVTLPSVVHDWRVSVAKACGVLAADASDDVILQYFNARSTLLVETGTAGIVSSQITVTVTQGADPWPNTDNSSSDEDAAPARVCFLEKDTGGHIVGGTASATTELGDFVMFRVRNKDGGGGGKADVVVSGHGSASISFDGAGQTGAVRLGSGW